MKDETDRTNSGHAASGPGLSDVASAFVPQTLSADDSDAFIRSSAFARLDEIVATHGSTVPWSVLRDGFRVDGATILFASRAEGIFKPRQMRSVLSIKTTIPRDGRFACYADQSHSGGFRSGSIGILYDFKGTDPFDPRNQLLWEAYLRRLPLIYFFGVGPSLYEIVAPVFVESWDAGSLKVQLTTSLRELHDNALAFPPSQDERRDTAGQPATTSAGFSRTGA